MPWFPCNKCWLVGIVRESGCASSRGTFTQPHVSRKLLPQTTAAPFNLQPLYVTTLVRCTLHYYSATSAQIMSPFIAALKAGMRVRYTEMVPF